MEMLMEMLTTLLQAVLVAAIPILSGFGIRLLHGKTAEAKESARSEVSKRYVSEIGGAITTAVAAVAQTYTDDLKKSDKFTADNQREALNQATEIARIMLTEEASRFLNSANGDVSKYLESKIEAEIKLQRQ